MKDASKMYCLVWNMQYSLWKSPLSEKMIFAEDMGL